MQGGIRASLVCVSSLNYCRWHVAVMYVGVLAATNMFLVRMFDGANFGL